MTESKWRKIRKEKKISKKKAKDEAYPRRFFRTNKKGHGRT